MGNKYLCCMITPPTLSVDLRGNQMRRSEYQIWTETDQHSMTSVFQRTSLASHMHLIRAQKPESSPLYSSSKTDLSLSLEMLKSSNSFQLDFASKCY